MGAGTEMSRLDSLPTATLNKLLEMSEQTIIPTSVTSPQDGDTLVYDGTAHVWKNGSSSSGGGVLVVTSSYDEETGNIETLDKTWAEIKSAVEAGMLVIKKEGNLPVNHFCYINTLTGSADPVNDYTVSFTCIQKVEDTISTDVYTYSTTSESGYPSLDWSGS